MLLVIDIGNTTQKAAVFDEAGSMVRHIQHEMLTCARIEPLLSQYPIRAAIISSVGTADDATMAMLDRETHLLRFGPELSLPIDLRYGTQDTLGTDRIACAVGAHALHPGLNTLAIQMGTCLVTDFVTAAGVYMGGSIAPGMNMRFHSLHEHTAKLPLIVPRPVGDMTGNSTEDSILSGVIHGMSCEIDGIIQHYQTRYSDIQVVVTGGDADFLSHYIKNRIFAAPNLVLWGLYKILAFNVA